MTYFHCKPEDIAVEAGYAMFGIKPDEGWLTDINSGRKGYQAWQSGPDGLQLWYTPGRNDCHLVFPGECCERASTGKIYDLINYPGGRMTRIHLAVDGLKQSPEFIKEICTKHPEQVRTRVQLTIDPETPRLERPENWHWHQGPQGNTFKLGSLHSERNCKWYDRRGDTRMELEIKGERAQKSQFLFHDIDQLPTVTMGLIRNFVDFIEPIYGETNKSKCPLQEWWQEIVGPAATQHIRLDNPNKDIEAMWQWMADAGSATLLALHKASGIPPAELMNLILKKGEKAYGKRHDAAVKNAKNWKPT